MEGTLIKMQKIVSIAHWNIGGIPQKHMGHCKIDDPEFKKEVLGKSIIILTETHFGKDPNVNMPGYRSHFFSREKHHKAKKYSGGIGIFIKDEIKKGIEVIPNKNPDVVWLKADWKFFGLQQDLYIGAVYFSPKNSTYTQRNGEIAINRLNMDVATLSKKGKVLIVGDFNARTGTEQDCIVHDDNTYTPFCEDYVLENDMLLPRQNRDSKVCGFGRELLDFCISSRTRILNGRCLGDLQGSFTCHQYNGSSTVDYALVDEDIIDDIAYFKVHGFRSDLSDHCMISLGFKAQWKCLPNEHGTNLYNLDGKIKWLLQGGRRNFPQGMWY